ncbi:MAG TPA: galactokinase [Chitinophagaceae bacterium]|nr:galactokinase [Chitinophagaceae bacterium]
MNQSAFNIKGIKEKFSELYGEEPIIIRSPGRVNIIGEHTDYNEGFVLPAAIDKAIYIAINKRTDEEIHLYAQDYKQAYTSSLSTVAPTEEGWPNYILGVVDQLQKRGYQLGGFNLVIDGDVPLGAGLSSSAAVECATAYALNHIYSLGAEKLELVKAAQLAEHTFAGVLCGIMDQFASMFGKKDHVIKLDCRSLHYEYVPLDLKGYRILLLNTNVKHSLASSEYNTRREQCEQGVAWIKKHYPHVNSLREATMQMLNEHVAGRDQVIYKRCKYVVEEIERLLTGCEDLKAGNLKALGEKMFRTHEGLSKEYEVSCKELDFLVQEVKGEASVLGARMMGGGFGGCTINLVKEEHIDALVEKISKDYKAAMDLELSAYVAQIEDGTALVSAN